MIREQRLQVAYTMLYQLWQLGADHPTNPIRAELAVDLLRGVVPAEDMIVIDPSEVTYFELETELTRVHDREYVKRVFAGDLGDEADRVDPELGRAAAAMFAGTVTLMRGLERDGWPPRVGFNPQGAKHHAMPARANGFCAFNDMAWAAVWAIEQGMRVAYLDWDAHHGDGVEHMLRDAGDAMTYSIHEQGIFPGTGNRSDAGRSVWNRPLQTGAGDRALTNGVTDFINKAIAFKPDVLLLAAGADGLAADPLTGLRFTTPGIIKEARRVAQWAARRGIPVVVGGAGGYTPYKETPITWAGVVASMHQEFAHVHQGG